MKRLSPVLAAILLQSIPTQVAGSEDMPVYRDAATHEQLELELRKFRQRDPMKKLETVHGEDPTKVNQPINLLEQSDIISFGGFTTLVPKQAILSTPEDHKEHLGMKPGTRIVGWSEFYKRNRGWITTIEVSQAQAEGNEAIAKEKRDYIATSSNLVVAVLKGGPISVLPLKIDPEATITQTEAE